MKYSVGELARRCGCSVRTLHYYDEIGLLHPSEITEAGYRYYDGDAEKALLQILFYRELELPLREIARVVCGSETERTAALRAHRELLLLRRKRMDGLLQALNEALEGKQMKKPKITAEDIQRTKECYADEVRQRWGETDAYRQSEEKNASRTIAQNVQAERDAGDIFTAFAAAMDLDPAGETAQELVRRWQEHITKYYYDCTKEILACLGEMYVADSRFTENIDRYGDGTAAFMRDAIRAYCA